VDLITSQAGRPRQVTELRNRAMTSPFRQAYLIQVNTYSVRGRGIERKLRDLMTCLKCHLRLEVLEDNLLIAPSIIIIIIIIMAGIT